MPQASSAPLHGSWPSHRARQPATRLDQGHATRVGEALYSLVVVFQHQQHKTPRQIPSSPRFFSTTIRNQSLEQHKTPRQIPSSPAGGRVRQSMRNLQAHGRPHAAPRPPASELSKEAALLIGGIDHLISFGVSFRPRHRYDYAFAEVVPQDAGVLHHINDAPQGRLQVIRLQEEQQRRVPWRIVTVSGIVVRFNGSTAREPWLGRAYRRSHFRR